MTNRSEELWWVDRGNVEVYQHKGSLLQTQMEHERENNFPYQETKHESPEGGINYFNVWE